MLVDQSENILKELGLWFLQSLSPIGYAYNPWIQIIFFGGFLAINYFFPYFVSDWVLTHWWAWALASLVYPLTSFVVWAYDA